MKYCSKCGASVAAENKFCTMCGCLIEDTPVSNEVVNQAAPVQENVEMNQMPINNMGQNQQIPSGGYNNYNGYNGYNSYGTVPMNNMNQGPKTNGLAIGGFICSLVGMLCCFIPMIGIVGLILSIVGINKIKTSGEKGKGLAIAGIILGAIAVALYVILLLIGIFGEAASYSSF